MKKGLLCVGLLIVFSATHAQQKQDSLKVEQLEEIVISDSRFKLKREHSGKTVIKISAKELENNQGKTVSEIINAKSGIEINGSRSQGGQTLSTFIRGGNNRQVLVLIDGIPVSDPSQIVNDFDLRLLDVNQIETIEIIKGAASTLYGNKAATAVINITSKRSSKKAISTTISSHFGTNQSSDDNNFNIKDVTNTVSISGTLSKFNYMTSFAHQNQNGLSAAKNGTEKDDFNRNAIKTRIGYDFSKQFSAIIFANHTKFKADFDNSFPVGDADFYSENEQNRFGLSTNYTYKKGSLNLKASYNKVTRRIESSFPNNFKAKSLVFDLYNKYTFKNAIYTIIGINYIKDKTDFTEEKETETIDPYLNTVWISDFGLHLNVGARLNNHNEYGTHLIYNFNPSYTYKFNDNYAKLLASYSTSFIAPTMNHLYGFFGANPDLKPEENTTFEAGFEVKLKNNIRFNVLYFNRKEKNFIDYVVTDFITFAGEYQNTNTDFTVKGVEIEVEAKLTNTLDFNVNYTFTEKDDVIALRIPKNKVNVSLNYTPNSKNYVSLKYQFVDDRLDTDFSTFQNETLKSFSLIDALYSHDLIPNKLKIYTSITNILDEDYTEVIGYTTKGRNYKLGFSFKF
jgi:vitamin B12 transporter